MIPTSQEYSHWGSLGRQVKRQQDEAFRKLFAPKIEAEFFEDGVKVTRYSCVMGVTPQYVKGTGRKAYSVEYS